MKSASSKLFPVWLRAGILGVTVICLTGCSNHAGKEYTILRGNFIQTVTESGELQARSASSVGLPMINYRYGYSFKLIGLIDHGTMVHAGDSVAALDPSSVYKFIISKEESLEKVRARTEKQKVQSENSIRDLEVQLKNETAAWELKKLELERIRFESELKKQVKELEFRQATIRLEKIKRNLELKPRIEGYDNIINRFTIRQHQEDIESAKNALGSLVLYSPGNGLFQVSNNRRNNQMLKLGDEIYMGSQVATIPDISTMKAISFINETDIRKVYQGMKVNVRLDALPNVTFRGELTTISKICIEQDDQKIFTTEINILDIDERLKPGMSVSCEYVCVEKEDAFYVPNNCLLKEDGKAWIFLKKSGGSQKVEVEAGPSNANYTLVTGDLKAGRELTPVNAEI